MPPPRPDVGPEQIVEFFHAHSLTIRIGFGLLMIVVGFTVVANGLIALQIKRMSVAPVFAYAYIASLALGAVLSCLIAALAFLTAVFRPDREAVFGFVTANVVPDGVAAPNVPAPMPPGVANHVGAVALFGKPSNRFMTAIDQPSIAVGPLYAAKTIDLCVPDDPICSSGRDISAHVQYVEAAMVDQAATFATSRLVASFRDAPHQHRATLARQRRLARDDGSSSGTEQLSRR